MKLNTSQATQYLKGENPSELTLIFSENTARARSELQKFSTKILGETAQNEMRLDTLDAREVAKEPAILNDAMRSSSFFGGKRAVIIFDAVDGLADAVLQSLEDWQDGDALIFLQAGNLKKTSKLRKHFEPHSKAAVIALYDDPLREDTVKSMIKAHGIRLTDDALNALISFASSYDRSAFEPFLTQLRLYQGEAEFVELHELQALLPGQNSATEDEIINAMFRGDARVMVQELKRATGQGITIGRISMLAIWRARTLFELLSQPNPHQAIHSIRPPLFGARKQAVEENLRRWKKTNLDQAIIALSEAEKEIRSGRTFLPERAFMERVFLRVAMLSR